MFCVALRCFHNLDCVATSNLGNGNYYVMTMVKWWAKANSKGGNFWYLIPSLTLTHSMTQIHEEVTKFASCELAFVYHFSMYPNEQPKHFWSSLYSVALYKTIHKVTLDQPGCCLAKLYMS